MTDAKALTTSSLRLGAIDGTRALAMLMVYVFHVWEFGLRPRATIAVAGHSMNLFAPISEFTSGVDLFMVISGFCLFYPLCKASDTPMKLNAADFFKRRWHRIAPPYYLAIIYPIVLPQLLVILFMFAHQPAHWQPLPGLWQILTHVTFTHTLFTSTIAGINGSFWTLGLEAQFYLAFPLAVWGVRKYGPRFLAVMCIASFLFYSCAIKFAPNPDLRFVITSFFLSRWMQFAAGMYGAYFVAKHYREGPKEKRLLGAPLCVFALVLYIIGVSQFSTRIGDHFPLRETALSLAFAALLVSVTCSRTLLRSFLESKPMAYLGYISYSIYLLHQPTAWFVSEFLKKKLHLQGTSLFILLVTVGFALVVAVSQIFFRYCEYPFLQKARKLPQPGATQRA